MAKRPDDNLYNLGWGSSDEQSVGKPLELLSDLLAKQRAKMGRALTADLKAIGEKLAGLQGKLGGNVALWCEECRVTLNHCESMVTGNLADKLLCVQHALDNICDKCPDIAAFVHDLRQSIAPPPAAIATVTAVPVPSGSNVPPVGSIDTATVSATGPVTFPSAGQVFSEQLQIPQNVLPPVRPQVPPIVHAVAPNIGGLIDPNTGLPVAPVDPGPFPGGYCNVHSPITNCRHTVPSFAVQSYLDAGSVLISCGNDPMLLSQIAERWNRINCQGGSKPTLPPIVPVPAPTIPPVIPIPGQPPQCIVCNQCQPTATPCPKCEKAKFCIWKSADGTTCYMLPELAIPIQPTDIKLDCSDDVAVLSSQIRAACQKQTTPTQSTTVQPIEIGSGRLLCEIMAYSSTGSASNFIRGLTTSPLTQLLFGSQDGYTSLLDKFAALLGIANPISQLSGKLGEVLLRVVENIDKTLADALKRTGCVSQDFIMPATAYILIGLIEKYVASDLVWVSQPLKYAANSNCPVLFPGIEEATEAHVRGTIDLPTFLQWTRQNNYCNEPWNKVLEARWARLSPIELTVAYRRGWISDKEYRSEIRRNGFPGTRVPDIFLGMTAAIPPISDLIRMMVRDVEDPTIVSQFGLDDQFTNKWTGQLETWGNQQGITKDVAKRYWRAHWQIPSPTQLFDMFHRSRALDPTDPAYVSYDQVRSALVYQDIAPFWIDRLLNTTYSLLRLVDIRRAFAIGALDETGVTLQLIKRGYSNEDADTITAFYASEKQEQLLRSKAVRMYERCELSRMEMESRLLEAGATTATIERAVHDAQPKLLRSRPVKLYERRAITEAELRRSLLECGATPETIDTAIATGRRIRNGPHRQRCLSAIRKRYLTGEFGEVELRAGLVSVGASPDEAEEIVGLWNCEKAARAKEFTAAQMCQFIEYGILSPLDMFQRLMRIGWKEEDAYAIVSHCGLKLSGKAQKELARLEKDRERQAAKAQQAIARSLAAAERKKAQEQARIDKLKAAQQAREQRVETAIVQLVELTGESYDNVGTAIRRIWSDIRRLYSLFPSEQVHIIATAIGRGKPKTLAEAEAIIFELADEAEQLASVSDN